MGQGHNCPGSCTGALIINHHVIWQRNNWGRQPWYSPPSINDSQQIKRGACTFAHHASQQAKTHFVGHSRAYPRLQVSVWTELLGVQEGAELGIMVEEEQTKQVEWLAIHFAVPATKSKETYSHINADLCKATPLLRALLSQHTETHLGMYLAIIA